MTTTNDRLNFLVRKYQEVTKAEKQKGIIEDICFEKKQISDFMMLLDYAKQFNFDLSFSKAIIDNFFEWPFDGKALITFYKKVKGKVFENYFVGNIYRKNMTFKTLEHLYSEIKSDKDLSKIIFQVMLSTALSIEHFLSLLYCNDSDKNLEQQLLIEIKRRTSCIDFWIKALDRAKTASTLWIYIENLIKQITLRRSFTSAYKLYMESTETKAAPILLEAIALMAETKEELSIILYVAPHESEEYLSANKKRNEMN